MPTGLDGNPNPITTTARDAVRASVSLAIQAARRTDGCSLIAVDGIDGAGKSTFADELAGVLLADGVTVIRSTTDSFHNPRTVRWRRGKTSPDGFYLDSHDLTTLRRFLLE